MAFLFSLYKIISISRKRENELNERENKLSELENKLNDRENKFNELMDEMKGKEEEMKDEKKEMKDEKKEINITDYLIEWTLIVFCFLVRPFLQFPLLPLREDTKQTKGRTQSRKTTLKQEQCPIPLICVQKPFLTYFY